MHTVHIIMPWSSRENLWYMVMIVTLLSLERTCTRASATNKSHACACGMSSMTNMRPQRLCLILGRSNKNGLISWTYIAVRTSVGQKFDSVGLYFETSSTPWGACKAALRTANRRLGVDRPMAPATTPPSSHWPVVSNLPRAIPLTPLWEPTSHNHQFCHQTDTFPKDPSSSPSLTTTRGPARTWASERESTWRSSTTRTVTGGRRGVCRRCGRATSHPITWLNTRPSRQKSKWSVRRVYCTPSWACMFVCRETSSTA